MLEIISKIPIFVWPLFAVLLIGGLKARKTGMVPLAVMLAIPSAFFIWGVISFFGSYADPISIFLWVFCLSVGFFAGYFHMQKLKLRFDKQKRRVEMPGSWIPLILSMSIFTVKFSSGMLVSMFPELSGSKLMLGLDLFGTVILGIFAGRGIGCLSRYRAASEDVI